MAGTGFGGFCFAEFIVDVGVVVLETELFLSVLLCFAQFAALAILKAIRLCPFLAKKIQSNK